MKSKEAVNARIESFVYIKDDTKINLCSSEKDRIQLIIEALTWVLE